MKMLPPPPGTPGSRAVAIANRHAATAVAAGGGATDAARCMTLAYAKSRMEASMTGDCDLDYSHTTGSCYTGRGATAAGSFAGSLQRRRASTHSVPQPTPEKSRKARSRSAGAKQPQRAQSWQPAEDVRAFGGKSCAQPAQGSRHTVTRHYCRPPTLRPAPRTTRRPCSCTQARRLPQQVQVRTRRSARLRPEDVMMQALRREASALRPRDALPSRSASMRAAPREARGEACGCQGWTVATGETAERPRRSQSLRQDGGAMQMQRLQHALAPAPQGHSAGSPPLRSQSWHASQSAGYHPSGRSAASQLAVEEGDNQRGGASMSRVEALRLKLRRWQLTYEKQQGAPYGRK